MRKSSATGGDSWMKSPPVVNDKRYGSAMRRLRGGIITGTASFNPRVDLSLLKLPEPAYLVRGHVPLSDPCIDSVLTHAQVCADFLYAQPSIGHALTC